MIESRLINFIEGERESDQISGDVSMLGEGDHVADVHWEEEGRRWELKFSKSFFALVFHISAELRTPEYKNFAVFKETKETK